jgi:polar amino acid transport system substrate-binding protein
MFTAIFRMRSAAFSLALFLGLTTGSVAEPGHLAQIQERGTLNLLCFPSSRGTHAFVRLDQLAEAGKPLAELHDPKYFAGFEIDLVQRFADELGVRLEIHAVTTTYSDLVQALVDGKGDLIASSLSITEARQRILDFTTPVSSGWISVIVPKESQISKLDDLRGRKGAVMQGSSQQQALEKLGIENLELMLTDFSVENLAALEEGRADFTLVDTSLQPGDALLPDAPNLKVAFHLREYGNAIALPKGSDVIPRLNAFLEKMIAGGELDRLKAAYEGRGPAGP